nr:hypothetical transcript [Hymenolepis microstoma]
MHSFLSLTDLKGYLYQLITALVYCHDRQVVHRSVKPDNLLIDPIRKHLQLSGWSNAVVLNSTDHSEFNPLSYEYLSPELLLRGPACHSLGIMHREVKPSNPVVNPKRRQLRLVDWGQATYYHPDQEYSVFFRTVNYKSSEMHLDLRRYNFAVDMWPVGCILASAIFRQRHMFPGRTKKEVLLQIIQVVGSATMLDAIKKYGSDEFKEDKAFMNIRAMDFQSCVNASNKQVAIKSAVDLVSKLLVCDPEKRYTAAQALRHSYLRRAHQFPGELVI